MRLLQLCLLQSGRELDAAVMKLLQRSSMLEGAAWCRASGHNGQPRPGQLYQLTPGCHQLQRDPSSVLKTSSQAQAHGSRLQAESNRFRGQQAPDERAIGKCVLVR